MPGTADQEAPRIDAVGDSMRVGDRMLVCLGMPGLTATERAVLAVIAYHDGNGGARPAAKRIAELAGTSRAQAFAHIGELERKGRLRRSKWRGANRYDVAYGDPFIEGEAVREFQTVSEAGSCQEIPDSIGARKLSGNSRRSCQGIPDTNRKEPEGSTGAPPAAPADRAVAPSTESVSTGNEKEISLSSPSIHPREAERENQSFARCASTGKGKGSPATAKQREAIEMRLGAKYGADIPAEAWPWLDDLTVPEASHVIASHSFEGLKMAKILDSVSNAEPTTAAGTEDPPPPKPVDQSEVRFETDTGTYQISMNSLLWAHPGLTRDRAWELLGAGGTGTHGNGGWADGHDVNRYVKGLLTRAGFPSRAEDST